MMRASLRKIVVGADLGPRGRALTPGSELAVRQAELVAGRFGAPVCVVHSSALDEHWEPERGEYVVSEGTGEAGRAALEAAVEGLRGAGVEARLVVSQERAWLALLREARGAEGLVIVGKRSNDVSDGRRLGSVSLKLLHACPGDVWVVRPDSNLQPKLVLAAGDLTPVGEEVVRTAAAVAGAFGSELHVVHACSLPMSVQIEGPRAEASYEREARDVASQQIRAWLAGSEVAESAKLHVGITSPTQAILAGEARLSPDLVVMGTVSRGVVAGFFIGHTAERLLGRLDCSLLTVKPEDFVCPVTDV